MGRGSAAMNGLESRAARSLGLAGDAGEPLLLALALLNAAEVSWLLGRQVLASSTFMMLMYFSSKVMSSTTYPNREHILKKVSLDTEG